MEFEVPGRFYRAASLVNVAYVFDIVAKQCQRHAKGMPKALWKPFLLVFGSSCRSPNVTEEL